jgi:DNA-directed RNA polymerase specialized sigma24 family protein
MTNELTDQEIIGARLNEMRSAMIGMLIFKLRLEPHDAEDVFSEVTVYLLENGPRLLDMEKEMGGAIRKLTRMRGLNHIRNNKRIVHGWFNHREEWGFSSDDNPERWDELIDMNVIAADVLESVERPSHRAPLAAIMAGEQINVVAREQGWNQNTLHSVWKRMRYKMKARYEQEEEV